jgi:hypothetical protein
MAGRGCIITGPAMTTPPGGTTFCADGMIPGVAGLEYADVIMGIMVVWLGAGTIAAAAAAAVVMAAWKAAVGVAGADEIILTEVALTALKGELGNVALR